MSDTKNRNGVLTIYPPQIPGLVNATHPENPEGGIPLSLSVVGFIHNVVDPWVEQSLNDTASLLTNGSEIADATQIIGPDELHKSFDMFLTVFSLNEGINRLRLRVKRLSQPMPEISAPLVLLYHAERPGGEIAGSGDNPNLELSFASIIIDKGVDAPSAAAGVDATLSYIFMRELDEITFYLDGTTIKHTVTAAEVTAKRVVIKLTTEHFWQDNKRFALRFGVTDQLGNRSGPQAFWSATTYLDVHIRQPVLDLIAPKVLEARDSNGTVLNFVRDFYEARYATVEVRYPGSAPRQSVKVYWIGRNSTYGSEIQIVTAAGQTLQFRVPREEVVDTVGSGASVYYTVQLPGSNEDRPSKSLDITITEQKHRLGEPTLNAAKNNLRASYPELGKPPVPHKVRISLTVGTTRYDSAEIFIVEGSTYTDVPVPSSWITPNKGKLGLFNFTLKKTGTTEPIIFSWYLRVVL
ncbi:hypothetical protein [Pseudomonas sp. MWU318]|uniref:hypothetical protein n=1 Tax=Pseudomonas sp. MWU318 TaxID=2802569 RepID=UPI001927F92A|nr:hypothetical protein [Pseudomonas sp. MWU318]